MPWKWDKWIFLSVPTDLEVCEFGNLSGFKKGYRVSRVINQTVVSNWRKYNIQNWFLFANCTAFVTVLCVWILVGPWLTKSSGIRTFRETFLMDQPATGILGTFLEHRSEQLLWFILHLLPNNVLSFLLLSGTITIVTVRKFMRIYIPTGKIKNKIASNFIRILCYVIYFEDLLVVNGLSSHPSFYNSSIVNPASIELHR